MMRVRNNSKSSVPIALENPLDGSNQQLWSNLLGEIALGSQSALTSLYNDTSPLVFGLILQIVGDRAIAEETLLEVFQQVWREAGLYDVRCTQPLSWLLKIARLRAIDCLRSGRCKNDFKNPISEDSPIEIPRDEPQQVSFITQQQRLARAALASLSSSQRAVIELAYYHGLSQSEIASRLELSPETVKINIKLAMMKLHEFLNPVLQEQL
jgi:RNA polymerase sigma-70 factor (ECF subfamily)